MRLEPDDENYLNYLDSLTLDQLFELDASENVDVVTAIGKNYNRQRKFTDAEYHFKLAIELKPNDPWPLLFMGNLYFNWNKKSRAIEQFQKASRLVPDIACPYWCIADVYATMLNEDLATEMYEKAVLVDPSDEQAEQKLQSWNARRRT